MSFPLLKENQISLSGIEVKTKMEKCLLKLLFATVYQKEFNSKNRFRFSYSDQMDEPLARQEFDLTVLLENFQQKAVSNVFVFEEKVCVRVKFRKQIGS